MSLNIHSVNGRTEGPTLTPETADLGVLVRVLGSSMNRGLSGYIIGGENTGRVTVEFDNGGSYEYPTDKLQLYMPHGRVEHDPNVRKRKPIVRVPPAQSSYQAPQPVSPFRQPVGAGGQVVARGQQHLHKPGAPAVPVSSKTTAPKSAPKSKAEQKLFRKHAPWNF